MWSKNFIKPVTTDKHDYQYSRNFFAEKFPLVTSVCYSKSLTLASDRFISVLHHQELGWDVYMRYSKLAMYVP